MLEVALQNDEMGRLEAQTEPDFDALHNDPAFRALVELPSDS